MVGGSFALVILAAPLITLLQPSGTMGCTNSAGPQPGITDSQKIEIKKSWESFKRKGSITDIGMPMFIK